MSTKKKAATDELPMEPQYHNTNEDVKLDIIRLKLILAIQTAKHPKPDDWVEPDPPTLEELRGRLQRMKESGEEDSIAYEILRLKIVLREGEEQSEQREQRKGGDKK